MKPHGPGQTAREPSWLGAHEFTSDDGNGSVAVVAKGARLEVTLEVAQADGCTGSVGGTLEIHDTRARLAPPLFVVAGTGRDAGTDPCDVELELRPNGTIAVTERACDAYHGIACHFAGDYPVARRK